MRTEPWGWGPGSRPTRWYTPGPVGPRQGPFLQKGTLLCVDTGVRKEEGPGSSTGAQAQAQSFGGPSVGVSLSQVQWEQWSSGPWVRKSGWVWSASGGRSGNAVPQVWSSQESVGLVDQFSGVASQSSTLLVSQGGQWTQFSLYHGGMGFFISSVIKVCKLTECHLNNQSCPYHSSRKVMLLISFSEEMYQRKKCVIKAIIFLPVLSTP